MEFLIILAVLVLVAAVVLRPVLHPEPPEDERRADRLAELEAAREAKYREIRDAELDHRTGKLSDEDFQALDSGLRAEAIEILRAFDELRAERAEQPHDGS